VRGRAAIDVLQFHSHSPNAESLTGNSEPMEPVYGFKSRPEAEAWIEADRAKHRPGRRPKLAANLGGPDETRLLSFQPIGRNRR
jgi:hypothetical protein